MKKRVLSMLLAFILCFSTLPMTAFAQETDAVAEQEEQQEADSAEEQEEQQEADSAEGQEEQQEADSAEGQEKQQEAAPVTEQKEAEAAAAPGEETSSDKSTTAGEAPDTVESAVESVSDSDAGTQDTGADDEKKAAVQKVQALIDALPETVTEENAERVIEQLEAIDEAMAELTEEQREELNMTRLHAISEALNTPMTVPMTVAEGKHTDHPICGTICTDGDEHDTVTDWKPIDSEAELQAAMAGYYYLTQDIVTTETWKPKNNVVLCLNGHSIAANGDFVVIEIEKGQFTLCDCNSSASTHYFSESVENNFTRWVPCEKDTENCIPVTGGVITHSAGTSNSGVKVDESGTFTLYAGTICGNRIRDGLGYMGAGVHVNVSTFNMYGGAIRGNATSYGGGVATFGSTFNMYGGVISDNMVSAGGGGVLLSGKSVMNMSGNALISDNMAPKSGATGGGLYIDATFEGEGGNCLNMSGDAVISGNTASNGGAMYVRKNAQVTMSGNAKISNNTATENGGGIYIYENESAQVTMSDNAQITNNKAAENGGGVYVGNNIFKIAGGAPQVWNNWCQDAQNNVYLTSGQYIHISKKTSTFTGKIGVSTADTPAGSSLVSVAGVAVEAGGGGRLTEEDLDHICSDKENLYPVLVGGNVKLSATEPHRHPVCGATCGDSESHGNQTWIGVSNLTDIKSGGYYYLTDNVTLEKTWTCNDYVALCLNGKTITGAAGADAIKVASGKTLTITDCQDEVGKITHVAGEKGRGIYSLGNLSLYNGEITDNMITSGDGAGVYVDAGSFSMYNGSISANAASAGKGGGVYATNSTGLTISGGSISGNVAKSGGGIYYKSTLLKAIKFTISGGNIIGNAATNGNGGGVCLNVSSTLTDLTMSGGSITGNRTSINGGGVYMNASGKLTVSGAAKITDNTGTDSSKNNVYLPSGKTIIIGTKGMNSSADIGVTMGQQLTKGQRVAIAKGTSNDYTLTADDLNAFNSDTGYYKYALDNAVNFSNGELHVHGICGKEGCSEAGHGNVAWTGVSKIDEITSAGYYYLKNDITLNDVWEPTDGVVLCLNGNSIKAASSLKSISVHNTFTLTDCKGKDGSNYGQITNNTNINVLQSGSFYFYGGSITGNSFDTNLSTGVIVWGNFYMHGGEIVNNKTTGKGGGVYLGKTGTFTMTGGRIANNSAKEGGGGVYVDSDTITVSSAAQITGNKVVSDDGEASNNVYLPNGKKITVGGALSESASIGVTSGAVPDDSTPVTIATAVDNWIRDGNFTADSDFYKVAVSADGQTATLGLHEHQWKVRAKTGFDNILEEYCDVAGCTTAGGTLTLDADNQKYSGEAYDYAKCETSDDWKHTSTMGEVYYTDSTDSTDTKIDAPVKPGTYYANVTVDGVTAKRAFSIDRWKLSTSDFEYKAPDNLTYDGKAKEATVTSKKTGFGQLLQYTVLYFDKDCKKVENPTDAGTYTVEVQVTQSDAYEAGQIMNSDWTFAIVPKPVTITGALAKDKVYDGTDKAEIEETPAIEGLVDGDEADVMVDTSKAKATFEDANAGESKTVTFGGYALVGAKADNYKLSQPDSVTADIAPKELTIGDVTVADKAYDGKTEATITDVTFNGLVNSESLTKDKDYTVTGNFGDAAVGENKDVAVAVKLTDSVKNYTLSDTGYTKNGCKIVKAAVADPVATNLTIINGSSTIYTVMLPQLLPSPVSPGEYGKLTYNNPQLKITDSSYDGAAEVRRSEYEYGKLALQFNKTGTTEGPIGTITVTVHSDNYQDITLTINILATAKIVPQLEGTLKLTPSEITYGEKLSNITISGTMTANGKEITGTFAWQNPDDVLNAGNQQAAWKFTPDNTQTYAETTGTTTVKVNRAEQSGAVLMYNYTYNETPATPALTEQKGDNNATVTYYYSTTRTNSGGTEWKNIGPTTLNAGTYYMYAVIGETGNFNKYTTDAKAFTVLTAEPAYTKPSGLTAKYGQKLSEIKLSNPAGNMSGTWSWEAPDTVIDKTGTVSYGAVFTPSDTNYNEVVTTIEITVTPGDGRNLATEELTLAFNDSADHTYTPDWSGLPAGQTWNYECESSISNGSKATLTKLNVAAADGELTYAVSDGKAGDEITVILKARCNNYEDFTITLNIQITKALPTGAPKYTLITTEGKTLADAGLTLTDSTLKPAAGKLEWMDAAGNVLTDDTEVKVNTIYWWRFTPTDTNYNSLTGEIELYHVDAPAISAQPKSVSVTVGEKATFEVTATGTDVTYQWKIDRNDGNGFVDITGATGAAYTTGVTDKDCDGFKYQCVIRNAAGSATTDTVVLTVLYQIIEGANGSWNQSTDGESLRIRGNGEYSKFQNVKVDGNIIDSKNYTVSEGSTIIELHADYLKTLSEGSHTFEIVWTDGAAGTSFTVARNTSGSNSTGSNNTGNNDNNDSTDNSAAAAPTAAATAQELDKVPATGDASGIWIALFVVSAVGLAAMLVRRKKQ